jgi:quinol monooxygenase YgiN
MSIESARSIRPQAAKGEAMSKVSVVGSMTSQDGKAEQMEEVLKAMVEAAREEPGVEVYSYHRGEDNMFHFFALMSDSDSMQNHGQSEAMQAAMADIGPLMASPPQMTTLTPIAAVGFDV